eukprot:gb/GECH01009505.1/.p1 GENE.gb/GECH01009505.1/~~gb/GECH01009505.1/.p1  ORF type:complete len:424 (+),score=102.03 gb/GECH01009505.1/:1-1272(+)
MSQTTVGKNSPKKAKENKSKVTFTEVEKKNWLIHLLYTQQRYDECLSVLEKQLKDSQGLCEYALFIKGLIQRHRGKIEESLSLFQTATVLNPQNISNLKQVGRSLFLLGDYTQSIEIYRKALKINPEDWEIWHNKGLCHLYLREYEDAEEGFIKANAINKHDATYLMLGKVYTHQEREDEAIDCYLEALDYSPENSDILTTLGLLYLRKGDNNKAFEYLGTSLTYDPKNPKTILASGSILQDHNEMEVALTKYRVAAVSTPNSAQLWNNIGMCFFGQKKYVAAISCLKRALYLTPFEWIIAYNLGLVHLNTQQFATAFHYLSASINLKPDFASSYMYLAMSLIKLDDTDNAFRAYEKALELESDHYFELNYAISLFDNEQYEESYLHFIEFEKLFEKVPEEAKETDVLDARKSLRTRFNKMNF